MRTTTVDEAEAAARRIRALADGGYRFNGGPAVGADATDRSAVVMLGAVGLGLGLLMLARRRRRAR